MTVIADIVVDANDFALGRTFAVDPDVRVRLERVVPIGDRAIPYMWIADESLDAIEEMLREAPGIESFEIVDRIDGEALVRVDWGSAIDGLLGGILSVDAAILEAVGTAESWSLQLRFADQDDLAAFYRHCADEGVRLTLERVHNPGIPEDAGIGATLTEIQRETLHTAFETGYFAVPRETNLVELADRLGVSDTAASQRLRRGIGTLIETTLDPSDPARGDAPTVDGDGSGPPE